MIPTPQLVTLIPGSHENSRLTRVFSSLGTRERIDENTRPLFGRDPLSRGISGSNLSLGSGSDREKEIDLPPHSFSVPCDSACLPSGTLEKGSDTRRGE